MRKLAVGFRQRVGLLVLDHLQAVLELAQNSDRLRSRSARRFIGYEPARAQRLDRLERAGRAQIGIAPAEDELLRLREEFDLADAAAPELDVVARDRDRAVAAMGVNLPLDGMDVLDRGVIEIAPPDERLDGFEERGARDLASPAHARALIIAARSQFWPMPS